MKNSLLLVTCNIYIAFIFFVTLLIGISGEFQKCTSAYCRIHPCSNMTCKGHNKVLFHNVTKCGCCHRCIEELEENNDCLFEMKGNIPDTQCGPHLRCEKHSERYINAFCKKISDIKDIKGCEYERKRIENNQFQILTYGLKPECNEFGDYALRQCKNGTLCQCVKTYKDEMGQTKIRPIFGTDIYTNAEKMNCLCSYQFEKTNEQLRELTHTLRENERWQMLDLNEKYNKHLDLPPIFYIRCQPNGNYERYQSYGNYSYCVDEETGQLQDRPVLHQHANDLPCYSYRYSLYTNCIKQYNRTVENYYKLQEKGFQIVAYDLPKCDLDGSYAPVQCQNNNCYCVNKEGKKYYKTKINRDDKYFASSQQCTCVRNQNYIRNIMKRDKITELYSKYQCDINGNYLPLQCSSTDCYCVDPITGYAYIDSHGSMSIALKTEREAIISLFCYQNYPEEHKSRLNKIFDI